MCECTAQIFDETQIMCIDRSTNLGADRKFVNGFSGQRFKEVFYTMSTAVAVYIPVN